MMNLWGALVPFFVLRIISALLANCIRVKPAAGTLRFFASAGQLAYQDPSQPNN